MLTFLYGVLICRMFLIYATSFDLTMVAGGRTGVILKHYVGTVVLQL